MYDRRMPLPSSVTCKQCIPRSSLKLHVKRMLTQVSGAFTIHSMQDKCCHRWRAKGDDAHNGQRVGDGRPDAAQLGSRTTVAIPSAHDTLRHLCMPTWAELIPSSI